MLHTDENETKMCKIVAQVPLENWAKNIFLDHNYVFNSDAQSGGPTVQDCKSSAWLVFRIVLSFIIHEIDLRHFSSKKFQC